MSDKKGSKEPADTSAMYMELSKQEKSGDFDKALRTCNKILNLTPKDETAFHCKMVCLMQLGKFEDAVRQIADTHFTNLDLIFEEAYCLYRMNKPEESLKILEKTSSKSDKIKELKAQVYYRLEMFEKSYELYRDILKNSSDDFEQERITNLQASAVYCKNVPVSNDGEEDDSYEMCYNKACQLLDKGEFEDAEKALIKAEEMCRELMKEEEADEEEIERETGIIRVQLGFAIQMQNSDRDRQAQGIYNSVLKSKPADIGLVAVASNNLVTLNKDQNIFDSKKRIKAATAEGVEHKLTTVHRAAIARNNALLAMYTNQVDLCKNLINELSNDFGDDYYDKENRNLIMAGVLARSGKTDEAVEMLIGKNKKSSDLERILIAAQVLLEKGDVSESIKILEQLPAKILHRTGLLSTMVSLYLAANNRSKAAKLLKEAVSSSNQNKSDQMKIVWRKTAEFHLKGDEPSVAAKSLEELLKSNPEDKTTLAQLVLAYAKFDLKKAMEMSTRLPEFTANRAIDVDTLEASATLSRYGKKPAGLNSPKPQTPEQQKEAAELKAKKKRKRKKKLPKNYNPNIDPDPERWIPKRERTGYRRTRKERRKGEKFTGAQGTAAGQAEAYDFSKKVSNAGAIPKSPQVQDPGPGAGARHVQRKQQKGKKKGGKSRF